MEVDAPFGAVADLVAHDASISSERAVHAGLADIAQPAVLDRDVFGVHESQNAVGIAAVGHKTIVRRVVGFLERKPEETHEAHRLLRRAADLHKPRQPRGDDLRRSAERVVRPEVQLASGPVEIPFARAVELLENVLDEVAVAGADLDGRFLTADDDDPFGLVDSLQLHDLVERPAGSPG